MPEVEPAAVPDSVTPAKLEVKPTPDPAANPPTNPESNQALVRIREIKSLVNQKVGNPVNLVDIDNVAGREYMAALLDAMKQLNSGSSSVPAMDRLEAAYQAVEEVLKTKGAPVVAQQPVAAPAPKPTPEPAVQQPVEPVAPATPIAPAAPVAESAPVPQAPVSTSAPEAPEPEPAKQPPPKTSPQVGGTKRWEDNSQQTANAASPSSATVAPAGEPAAPPVSNRAPVIKSLQDSATPLKTINDVPTAASVNSSETGDPLYTKEVTNGLNQLLSDWSLFKKSGLFGTGPKGIEHPLYAKVKDLQIPLLLAGRFEGATQEIKQSVTDYMNGWRYEQGIIYEQGEAFDHYLRRVIRHILDLQK